MLNRYGAKIFLQNSMLQQELYVTRFSKGTLSMRIMPTSGFERIWNNRVGPLSILLKRKKKRLK